MDIIARLATPLATPALSACVTIAVFGLGQSLRLFARVANFESRRVSVAGLALVAGIVTGILWRSHAIRMANGGLGTIEQTDRLAGIAVLAFGMLGALDDSFGDRTASGFRGHIRSALHGRFTTGFVKMVGGGIVALIVALHLSGPPTGAGPVMLWLARAGVIALAANAFNLIDTRPVRATLAFVLLSSWVAGGRPPEALFCGVGAAIAWFPLDRRRLAMLGDAGSNALGALLGTVIAATTSGAAICATLAVLAAFHVYTERRSVNADIDRVPWLRRLDGVFRG